MKALFLTGSIILSALIMIIAFENLGTNINGFMFLFYGVDSGFLLVLGLAFLGVLTGLFYAGLITTLLSSGKGDEESPGAEW